MNARIVASIAIALSLAMAACNPPVFESREVVPMNITRMDKNASRFSLDLFDPRALNSYRNVRLGSKRCPRALEVLYEGRSIDVVVKHYRHKDGHRSTRIDIASLSKRVCYA